MNIEMIFRDFPRLHTENLVLSEIINEDSKSIFSIYSNHAVMKYYGKEPMESINEAIDHIGRLAKGFNNKEVIRWGIRKKRQNELIGTCGFHNWAKEFFRAEIGFVMSKEYWGKGIIKEALTSILSFGFGAMKLNRIEALVEPGNIACTKLLEKMGFKKEGLLREYEFTKGKFDDLIMFSLLKKDFLIYVSGNAVKC